MVWNVAGMGYDVGSPPAGLACSMPPLHPPSWRSPVGVAHFQHVPHAAANHGARYLHVGCAVWVSAMPNMPSMPSGHVWAWPATGTTVMAPRQLAPPSSYRSVECPGPVLVQRGDVQRARHALQLSNHVHRVLVAAGRRHRGRKRQLCAHQRQACEVRASGMP